MKFTTFLPIFDRVLVQPIPVEGTDVNPKRVCSGKVIAVGDAKNLSDYKFTVAVMDIVIYEERAGNKIFNEGHEYVILKENEILGILDKHVKEVEKKRKSIEVENKHRQDIQVRHQIYKTQHPNF